MVNRSAYSFSYKDYNMFLKNYKKRFEKFDIKSGDSIIVLCDKIKGIALLKADEIEDFADKVFLKGNK